MFALLWALACRTPAPPPSTEAATVVLHGQVPTTVTTVPEFSAVNQDGAPRTRADLLGHPTVVWFFPAAGTAG